MTVHDDDDEHPRGRARNAGQFRDKPNSGPEAVLARGGPTPSGDNARDIIEAWFDGDDDDFVDRYREPDYTAIAKKVIDDEHYDWDLYDPNREQIEAMIRNAVSIGYHTRWDPSDAKI